MGLLNSKSNNSASSQDVIKSMLLIAETAVNDKNYKAAFDMYKQIVSLEANETAQFNLGVLYANGCGVKSDYLEAGYWFAQAQRSEDDEAEDKAYQCMVNFVYQDIKNKTPEEVYYSLIKFIKYVYPERYNEDEIGNILFFFAEQSNNSQNYTAAFKLFYACAQYADNGEAQNYLGIYFNLGYGVEQNDLAALYWWDKAASNGIEPALKDRNGVLNYYKASLSQKEFYEYMMMISGWCRVGNKDVPKDAQKAEYWREVAEKV
ncbi:MAG: sel1 repeat family protein [Eubacterium sp.]|nr:sel1 repeat family protein [Eubacterium sp.]